MMFDLLSDDVRRDPFPLYGRLRADCAVLEEASSGLWLLLDHDSVRRALHDQELFSSRVVPPTGAAPDWLVFSDPPRHTGLRALVLRAFTPRSIAALEPRVRAIARDLLAGPLAAGAMDVVADFATPLPVTVIAELIGIPPADRARFVRWSEAIVDLSYAVAGGAEAAAAIAVHAAARAEMLPYLLDLCEERRRAPADDLLSRLVAAEIDGARLGDDDLLGFFQLLLAAGTETTTNLISNAVLCFTDAPDQLARVRDDPALLPTAIEEVLRFRSPGQFMFRQTRREVTLHGRRIPADRLVLAVIGAANRDPLHFAEPDRFDAGRDPNPHIAFGHGIHFCLGAALARLEARVALEELMAAARHLERAAPGPWQPRRALHVHGPAALPVRLARAQPFFGRGTP